MSSSSSSLAPLIIFFFIFILHSHSTVALPFKLPKALLDFLERFDPTSFADLVKPSETHNVTVPPSSPIRYVEVKKPPVPETTKPVCSQQILNHEFDSTYSYKLPSDCQSQSFSKIVLQLNATSKGIQFDRIFGVWLNGVELLRSSTAEPTRDEIVWSVEKDVSKYHSLLVKKETQILSVFFGNLVNKTYAGVYHVDLFFHYYPLPLQGDDSSTSGYSSPQADLILPISRNLPLNDGLWFEIVDSNDTKYKEIEIPRNVYRAVLEVYVSFHDHDEFWYRNLPNDVSDPASGPFREVVVSLDGDIAGAVWPFPVVFSGGVSPLLWRPITAIGSFDLPSYDIEITPFLGRLLDGKSHKLGFSVTNALDTWYIDANLHLWLDQKKEVVEGKVLATEKSSLKISSDSKFEGGNEYFRTQAKRSITSVGLVKSSHGDIITNASQEFSYKNEMLRNKDGKRAIIKQSTQADDRILAKRGSGEIYAAKSIKSFPFSMVVYLEQQSDTTHGRLNVTIGFNEERSRSENETMLFKSTLENKQEGQLVLVSKNNLPTDRSVTTQQVYKYVGSDQCYFKNISSFNFKNIDTPPGKVDDVCKKITPVVEPAKSHGGQLPPMTFLNIYVLLVYIYCVT